MLAETAVPYSMVVPVYNLSKLQAVQQMSNLNCRNLYKVIGKQTFRNSFPKGSNLIIKLPTSVEIVGSEAFYSNSAFSQIYIERKSDLSGYSSTGFKANSSFRLFINFSKC